MVGKNGILDLKDQEEVVLADDPRWALAQRIVAIEHFRRADQLRNILLFICRNAILHPHRTLREFEIAVEVLGRKPDFNPASDNIVRAQFSHLRRRLETYFSEEGRAETIVLTIPRGGYSPVFAPASKPADTELPSVEETSTEGAEVAPSASSTVSLREADVGRSAWLSWRVLAASGGAVFLLATLLIGEFFLLTHRHPVNEEGAKPGNAFAQFLARSRGEVTIVVPDIALVALRHAGNSDISVSDYLGGDYPQRQLAAVKSPETRDLLAEMNAFRPTTISEAAVAFDFKEVLDQAGSRATVRYARDIHAQDLSQGNTILIGGASSNPWTSLFTDQLNFRFVDRDQDREYYFENARPAPGEQRRYEVVYAWRSQAALGYVDVALIQNASHTGYLMLIVGADAQAAEAAARFLLHGTLPPEIVSLLSRKDLNYFEIFLRGRHVGAEADDSFELVTLRPK